MNGNRMVIAEEVYLLIVISGCSKIVSKLT